MVHLSSPTGILIMIFYSILTFFIGPYLTMPFLKSSPENCVAGFTLGFALSIILWLKFGKELV